MTASSSKIKFVESEEEEDHEITSASSSEEVTISETYKKLSLFNLNSYAYLVFFFPNCFW